MGEPSILTLQILIRGIPIPMRFEELEPLVRAYGRVKQCEAVGSNDPNSQAVVVTYETADEAARAVEGLNGADIEGYHLRTASMDQNQCGQEHIPQTRAPGPGRPAVLPLRIIMPSDLVGAIIGPEGSTIRAISQECRARIDIHRKPNFGTLEKAFTIYANAKGCSSACKRILEIMYQEAQILSKGELPLKILAHDNFIGRIIGKNGNNIRRVMEETQTQITVNSMGTASAHNTDRIITIIGSVENMSRAEMDISAKIRQSYETDLLAMTQYTIFPALQRMASPSNGSSFQGLPYTSRHVYPTFTNMAVPPVFHTNVKETTYMYIPNMMVGAIIGRKGFQIRKIMRLANATLSILSCYSDHPLETHTNRKLTIIGTPEGQWKAQYMIYETIREGADLYSLDDVILTVELLVARSQIGRIIGKRGLHVRELQRITGSTIKFPEASAAPGSVGDEDTPVHIIGSFYAVQSAQRRIRSLIVATSPPPPTKKQKAAKAAAARACASEESSIQDQ